MTTIYLIRHAEAEGNLYRRVHGWYDALITDNGYRQMRALEKRMEGVRIDAVYSSDLFRTRTTALAVAKPRGLEIQTTPALREVHMGLWEDKTWGKVGREEGEQLALFQAGSTLWKAPEGESMEDVGRRVMAALEEIVRANPERHVAVFTHGMAIRQIVLRIKKLPNDQQHALRHNDNTAVTRLDWDGSAFSVVLDGDNSHLDPSISTLARQAWWRKETERNMVDVNFWFRPMDFEQESETYLQARQEFWNAVHGPQRPFDGAGYLRDAELHARRMEWGLTAAMSGEELAGILQLDPQRYSEDNAGYIPFCYIIPRLRGMSVGVQLIGQAVSVFRGLGRDSLRLRCASYNTGAQHFYKKHGFYKIGEESNSRVPLDILEKYIGYDVEKAMVLAEEK